MAEDPDDDDWPLEMVSLCEGCAKHPELKALVKSDLRRGVCGVCASSASQVYNPARFEEVRNLVRALIRLHFNEEDYNPHWGGTSVDDILLAEDNPILETSKSDRYSDEFIHRITWEGEIYPDRAKGIWLYAGSDDDGGRDLQFSIPQTNCSQLADIERSLEHQNFHAVEGAMEKLVSAIEADIEFEVRQDTLWYRGRIGVADSVIHIGDGEVTRIATPYKGGEIGARKQAEAEAGRMNRPGVSVLYLASEIETALAEIRPHPRHMISVGGFRARRSLRVARFDLPIRNFSSSDHRLELFALIYHIDSLLSLPIIPEERRRYAATQLLADVLIRHGFEGVTYRSSVGEGKNLCAFTPPAFAFDEAASAVKQVDRLHYTFSDVATSTPNN
jgi:hypothetical protein